MDVAENERAISDTREREFPHERPRRLMSGIHFTAQQSGDDAKGFDLLVADHGGGSTRTRGVALPERDGRLESGERSRVSQR